MASEQLKAVLELVGRADLGTLTLQERRALMGSAGAPLPEGIVMETRDWKGTDISAWPAVRDGFATSGSFQALFRSIATSPAFAVRDGRLQ